MKKFLALIFISTSILQGMEENPEKEKPDEITVNQSTQLWQILDYPGMPSLKFLTSLHITKLVKKPVKWVHVPEEVKLYLHDVQNRLGDKLFDLVISNDLTSINIALLLIKAGANINIQNKYGETALMIATYCNRQPVLKRQIAELLIDAGADVNIKNKQGKTALIEATAYRMKDSIVLLINANANLNVQTPDGLTALMIAADLGNPEILAQLIKAGASLNMQDKFGNTALILTIQENEYRDPSLRSCLQLLMKAGADVNIQNKYGETALIKASYYNKKEIVLLLVNSGADLNKQNARNQTALDIAKEHRNQEIIELLEV
jgi:uncharacterized protein